MTSREIFLSREAEGDLIDVWTYVASMSVERADAVIDQIWEKLRLLADTPLIGRERKELIPGLRNLPISKWVVFYRATDRGLEVVRVLSGNQDIERFF
jgi:toxin ParE1/3/4